MCNATGFSSDGASLLPGGKTIFPRKLLSSTHSLCSHDTSRQLPCRLRKARKFTGVSPVCSVSQGSFCKCNSGQETIGKNSVIPPETSAPPLHIASPVSLRKASAVLPIMVSITLVILDGCGAVVVSCILLGIQDDAQVCLALRTTDVKYEVQQ